MQEVILKKVMFGGYDGFDVMNHINAMRIKLNRAEKSSRELDELRDETKRLKAQLAAKEAEISELNGIIAEHEEKLRRDRPAEHFLRQSEEYAESYINAARSLESSVKEQTSTQIGKAKGQIEALQACLNEALNTVDELFVSISELKAEHKNVNKSCREILKKTSAVAEKAGKPTNAKKAATKKKSEKATAKTKAKSESDEAIELLDKTAAKYKKI